MAWRWTTGPALASHHDHWRRLGGEVALRQDVAAHSGGELLHPRHRYEPWKVANELLADLSLYRL